MPEAYYCLNCGAWVLPGTVLYLQNGYCNFCGNQLIKISDKND